MTSAKAKEVSNFTVCVSYLCNGACTVVSAVNVYLCVMVRALWCVLSTYAMPCVYLVVIVTVYHVFYVVYTKYAMLSIFLW